MRTLNPIHTLVGGLIIGVAVALLLKDKTSEAVTVVRAESDGCDAVRVVATPVPTPHIANATRLMMAVDSAPRSIWFEQEILDGAERRHLFFFKQEHPHSMVEVGAEIGVVSFVLEDDNKWRPELVEPILFRNGTRGEVTPQEQFQVERVSGDKLLMMVLNHIDTFEGVERHLDLFLVQNGRFSPAGRIFVGAHNGEMSCDGPVAKRTGFNRACIDFTGTPELVSVAGQPLADLKINFSGQAGDRDFNGAPVLYRFSQTHGRFIQE